MTEIKADINLGMFPDSGDLGCLSTSYMDTYCMSVANTLILWVKTVPLPILEIQNFHIS